VTRRYYAEGELAVAATGDVATFYTEDHLGSIRDLRMGDGQVLASYDYDPYGNPSRVSKTGGIHADYRYAGLVNHAQSGLYLAHFRAYSPATGRWISRDPIGEAGGINLYAYVGGNPISRIDPFELDWQFSQSTGQWSHVDNQTGAVAPVGQGYSGTGEGRNNPAMQDVPNVGPTPQGTYDIGPGHYSPNTGPNTMNLTPRPGTDTFGRDLFRIHGDNASHDASHGCAIAPPNVRRQINNSNDRVLRVVP
jgi:RHS repeat-associated protein